MKCALVTLTLALLCCGFPSLAQSTAPQLPGQQSAGSISGTVVDGTGAAVVGARVKLTRKDQSQNQEVLTGDEGRYSFANVAPGDFQITITAAGFAPQRSSGNLHAGESYIAPPSALALATANTAVEVVASRSELAEDEIKVEEKQRMLGLFPNFYVSYLPDALPLSPKQKFELAWRTMIDPASFVLTGATAGVQQSQNTFSGYGQGGQGYATRFAASYGDSVLDTFIGSALLPALLKQDPRYFYKGSGSARSRILYAVENVVICKGDNKRWQPNYSSVLGSLAAGGLSNLYYPSKDRGAELTFDNALTGLGTGAAVNLLQEFLIRKLTRNVPHYDPAKH